MPNLLRCMRWRVVARTEYEAGITAHTLTPNEQSSTGDDICVELISAATVKPGDELELSAVIVATLTGTESIHQGPCEACACGGDFGIRCGDCGREYQCRQCGRWCRKSDIRYDPKLRCPVCTGHVAPDAAPVMTVAPPGRPEQRAKVPRDEIRWWGFSVISVDTFHAVEQGKPVNAGLCGEKLPIGATWTELVQERRCCPRCLQRIDYGEQPAAAGA